MRPQFLVLCEGETEEAYVGFLRQRYRLPIRIVGSNISQQLIRRYKEEISDHPSEIRTFLMYDGEVPQVLDSLKRCDCPLLISCPCIEIWFIAHFRKSSGRALSSESLCKAALFHSGMGSLQEGLSNDWTAGSALEQSHECGQEHEGQDRCR